MDHRPQDTVASAVHVICTCHAFLLWRDMFMVGTSFCVRACVWRCSDLLLCTSLAWENKKRATRVRIGKKEQETCRICDCEMNNAVSPFCLSITFFFVLISLLGQHLKFSRHFSSQVSSTSASTQITYALRIMLHTAKNTKLQKRLTIFKVRVNTGENMLRQGNVLTNRMNVNPQSAGRYSTTDLPVHYIQTEHLPNTHSYTNTASLASTHMHPEITVQRGNVLFLQIAKLDKLNERQWKDKNV